MIRFGIACAFVLLLTAGVATAEPAGSLCERAHFRVIVDVGHSIDSPGAISARGVTEYEFNLKLAQVVDKALREAGFAKTHLLISTGKSKPTLHQRVARVNEMGADLLLSIHHDAVPKSFLEKWEYEGKPRVYSDRFKGHSIFVSEDNSDRKSSLLFGSLLGEQLKIRGMDYTPHYTESFMGKFQRTLVDAFSGVYRYDSLWLLRKSHMPAVLLEAGSIINRDEELLVASPERQALVSAAIRDAVETFCVAMARPSTVLVARTHTPKASQARAKPHRRVAETAAPAEDTRFVTPPY